MEDKITLDRESFRSLASDTRISIIKSLDRRRKMLTELSKELRMSPSTVKEHMDNLCAAGLAVQIDDGHKWKYYELTRKGKDILHPGETRIWILLSASILAMIGIFYDMLQRSAGGIMNVAQYSAREAAPAAGDAMKAVSGSGVPAAETAASVAPAALPYLHITALVLFAVLFGSCMAYLLLSRKKLMVKI